ncbi:MAG TPA: winged helix-turn-helix domain-containing protein, partial [Terriglobales bacterium]|nr:winged helix-turn-helix domain-containing protein [Terriglobales bacterium]
MSNLSHSRDLAFGSFRFDPIGLRLWRDRSEVPLQAKPAAVLAYLATNAGRVVLKQELLTAVWPGAVSPAVLKVAIRAIRVALDDTTTQPRFLETCGRAGYRFRSVERIRQTAGVAAPAFLVGREPELERLRQCFAAARSARRQLVFLTGEAGIGKTAVVDRFVTASA